MAQDIMVPSLWAEFFIPFYLKDESQGNALRTYVIVFMQEVEFSLSMHNLSCNNKS